SEGIGVRGKVFKNVGVRGTWVRGRVPHTFASFANVWVRAPAQRWSRSQCSSQLLSNGNRVTVNILEREFLHAVELVGDGHGDFRSQFLYAIEDGLQAVHFHVESQACADGRGSFWVFGRVGLL